MMLKRVLPAMLMALLIGGCGGGGGGGGDDDSAADSGETTTETADTGSDSDSDSGTVTPSTTDDTSTSPKAQFYTTFNSSEDFTFWGCEFDDPNYAQYGPTYLLLESGEGLYQLHDFESGEIVSELEGEWDADESVMVIVNEEEDLYTGVYDYAFLGETVWEATYPLQSEGVADPTIQCMLYDQDSKRVP